MSRLCRLRTKTHGEDGQWAYEEITKLRQRVQELEQQLTEAREREQATKFPDEKFWLKVSERWSE